MLEPRFRTNDGGECVDNDLRGDIVVAVSAIDAVASHTLALYLHLYLYAAAKAVEAGKIAVRVE